MTPHLIYCAGGNRRFARIAAEHGYLYGSRSDDTPALPVQMADLNWKRPDFDRHLRFVAEHRPLLAVAPDILDLVDLPATLRYAERLAEHAARVIVVPKVAGTMACLPQEPWLVIGYSVPSRYGGADGLLLAELAGWPVHLLGGNPQRQLALAQYLDVFSVDGNGFQKAARWGVYYSADRNRWVSRDPDLPHGPDLPYRAFARSCAEIRRAWETLYAAHTDDRPGNLAERLPEHAL